jgi:hypothetical protein
MRSQRLPRTTVVRLAFVALLPIALSGCGNPVEPLPACEYNQTGDLVLVNLSDSGAPRDVYVDGAIVTTLPYGGQTVVTASARFVHTVEWVSTITGGTRDVTRVALDVCTTTTLNNHF